jgi:hypothetical protein
MSGLPVIERQPAQATATRNTIIKPTRNQLSAKWRIAS